MRRQIVRNLKLRASQITVWQTATGAAVFLLALYLSAMSIELHRGLNTSAYDFGLYDQGIWLLSRFNSPFVTLMGRNLFGDHTSFILLFLVPFYWVVGSSSFLFVTQAVAIAAGAIPIFLYARKRLASEVYATIFAVVYLLHPATIWIGLENFHPDAFLGLFVALALYAAMESRWRLFTIAAILSLSVKEDVALVIVPLGLWIAWRRNLKIGLVTSAAALWYMLLAIFGIQQGINGVGFRNSWRIPFGGFGGLVKTIFSDPMQVLAHLGSESRPYYLLQMALPVGFIFLAAPEVAAIALFVVASNLISTFYYQFHIEYHYSFVIVPILVFGTIHAVGRLAEKFRVWLVAVCIVTSIFSAFFWAPLPGARTSIEYNGSKTEFVVAAFEALDKVPDSAVVSAFHPLTAQIARRERIYAFPVPYERALYGVDAFAVGDVLPFVDEIEFVVLPKSLDDKSAVIWAKFVDRYQITYANSWWVVYQRL